MANAAQVIMGGFARGCIHRLDAAGYIAGITGTLANGAAAGSYEMQGLKTADLAVPEPEKTNITGFNRFLGAFTWPMGESPSGSIEGSVYDHTLNAALEGTLVRTLGGLEITALGAKEATANSVAMILQLDAYSQTTGYKGQAKKFGLFVPKASAVALGTSTITERDALNARLALTILSADRMPWGELLTLVGQGATEALMLTFSSDYWVDLHAFRGDGAVDDVVLAHTPAGDHTATPARVQVWVDGTAAVPTTDFTVTVATRTVSFTAGHIPAAGAHVAILYEYAS